MVNNLNTGFYKDLDTNFELALEMSQQDFSDETLINMLKTGNIPEKQIAALSLNSIKNEADAKVLVDNLTGCEGKIREAVALRINRAITEQPETAGYFNQAETFAKASIDINGNICRLVIDSVSFLIKNETFCEKYKSLILNYIQEAFEELDKFIFRDKKYVINKQLFKLYWSLEALKLFADKMNYSELYPIIKRSSEEREYTIREKAAQIIIILNTEKFSEILEQLKKDENYYVRNACKN